MECSRIGEPGPCEDAVREMVREGMEVIRGIVFVKSKYLCNPHG